MVASFSPSSLLAFYLYVCNYDFQYLLPGYFQTWLCPYIFFSWELFPDCLFPGRVTLSVVGKIILGCGMVWPVQTRNLRVSLLLRVLPFLVYPYPYF